MADLRIKTSFILTWDEEKTIKEEGLEIKFVPLWKWLLNSG
jgi:predicted AAA+ superfamily ATPase